MRRICEFVALLAMVFMFGALAVHWGDVPDRVPTHFNAAGRPDAWGSKASLWLLPVIGVVSFGSLTVIARLKGARREVLGLLTVLKTIVAVSFAYIEVRIIMTAMGLANGLGSWFLPVMLGSLGATVLVAMKRFRRA